MKLYICVGLLSMSLLGAQLHRKVTDPRVLFECVLAPLKPESSINMFGSMEEMYKIYTGYTKDDPYSAATIPTTEEARSNIGYNEICVTLEYQERINPALRALLTGHGYEPKEQLASFRQLFLSGNTAEIARLRELAHTVLNWNFFTFAANREQIGLEFLTEWTHTASNLINNLNAFFFAEFLGDAQEVSSDAWEKFKETENFKKMVPLQTLIEKIVIPFSNRTGVCMSISASLQDLRRRAPEEIVFPESGKKEVEELLTQKVEVAQIKYRTAQQIVDEYRSVEDLYRALKAESPQKAMDANNIRREIGGTGFLIALQQAIKSRLVSASFYSRIKDFIGSLVSLTNEMDRCNFEINLGYGVYGDNAVPSPYRFFDRLNNK